MSATLPIDGWTKRSTISRERQKFAECGFMIMSRMSIRNLMIGGAAALALAVSAATPASAADSRSGTQNCLSHQQYGITSTLSATNAPTATTPTTHGYSNGLIRIVYGVGAKGTSNPGVSSGGWNVQVSSIYFILSANGTCGPKVN